MKQSTVNPYLRTKVMTASQEELRLLLFNGALKFCRQGKVALVERDFEGGYDNLTRAQSIVLELSTGLNREEDAKLCDRLKALYLYLYRRLVDASMRQDTAALDEVIGLLEYERDTWQMVMDRTAQERAESNGPSASAPVPSVPTSGGLTGYGPSTGRTGGTGGVGRLSQSA